MRDVQENKTVFKKLFFSGLGLRSGRQRPVSQKCEHSVNFLWKICEKFVNFLCPKCEFSVNGGKAPFPLYHILADLSRENLWIFCEHFMPKIWTFCEHSVNFLWIFCEHFMNILLIIYEHFVNILLTIYELFVNFLWTFCE